MAGRGVSTTAESGKFTSVVAPVLIAFTMPTVALIATSKDWPPEHYADSWRVATLSLFIVASGFFLAAVQLIDGDLRWWRVSTGAVRAVLTYLGLIFLGGALCHAGAALDAPYSPPALSAPSAPSAAVPSPV